MKNTYIKQLLAAILLLCCTVASAETYSGTFGENVTWSLDTETGVLNITGSGAMPNYTSYSYIPWLSYSSNITSVTIGNSVTTIGHFAFYNCTALTSITIPNSVTSIGEYAFEGCTGLTSIEIPSSVTSIKHFAFYDCTGLTAVHISDLSAWCKINFEENFSSPLYWAKNLYIGDSKVTDLVIPSDVTEIKKHAFRGCTGLTSITIPNSVTSIGDYAFQGCTGLTSIDIPNSVTSIGEDAFDYCLGLTSATIGNSVTSIGDYAFDDCTGLTSLTIHCENVGQWFRENSSIKEIILGENVKTIGQAAFSCFTGLTSITIPNSVTSIGKSAFTCCTGLTSITIPNSVTSIGDYAFRDCTGLTSIEIPNSVTAIGSYAFWGCTGLTSITILNSVTSIGEDAFCGCTGLTSITIPNSVTSIGDYAFQGCTGLTSITIHCENVGQWFRENSSIKKIILGENVRTMEHYAFINCSGLKEIYSLAETPATINSSTFGDFSATLYVPVGAKAAYQAAPYWNYFTNIVEMTPTEEETPTEVTITISQYGTATYCSPYALDFSEVEGLKAYTATGYNTSTGVVTLTRTKSAIESTGLFLMGEPGEYTVPVIEQANDYMLNMLVGTLEETAVNNKTDDGNYVNFKYTIGAESDQPMFYQFADGSTLSAGKAYLQLPASLFPSTASKSVSIRFDEGLTTDIDEVEGENNASQAVYDLFGRPVSKLEKGGIYIIDGKKVVL